MNDRQEKFCREYAACGNATTAAEKAGYSPKTARTIGSRLLTNVDICKRIQELGVREGERITVLSACFDGIIVRVRDLRLALGSDVAERIKV